MRIMKNSMISVATAAVLMTGFTGCSSDTNNTESGQIAKTNNPTGTVTGTVMDTNGNPLAGVKVFVADRETTTNAGGLYTFNDLAVTNTDSVSGTADTDNGSLHITIAAPEGYLGATVDVTPEAQNLNSGDGGEISSDTNPNTHFIDGYIATAGTAVLPKLDGTVHGVLENVDNGSRVEGVEVCLDLMSVDPLHDATAETADNLSYANGNYCATTVTGGVFDIQNVPSDSELRFNLAHWNVVQDGDTVIVEDTVVTDVNELLVRFINPMDTIAPMVVSVSEGLSAPTVARMMLIDDARTVITLNFSESIAQPGDLPDMDMTESVTVYVGATKASQTRVGATAVYSGGQLIVTLDTPLTDSQLVDINLLNTDFQDLSGNFLTNVGTPIGYDYSVGATTVTQIQLQAYDDLNLAAPAVTDEAQLEKDTLGSSFDNLDATRAYSNAFNDVNLAAADIQQLNAPEALIKLNILSNAQVGDSVVSSVNTARVTFTPSGAAGYIIQSSNANGVAQDVNIATETGANSNVSIDSLNGEPSVTVSAGMENTPMELVLNTVNIGDVVTITPFDDLNYLGTQVAIPLVDNVAPTTKTQPSYMRIFNSAGVTDGGVVVASFGDGGELTNGFTQNAAIGTPILGVTPGLLDNLDANGNDILAENTFVVGDETLRHELDVHTGKADPADTAPVITTANVYDATAWAVFSGNLERQIGVSFTEDIDLDGVTPTYTGTGINMGSFAAYNNVILNDSGNTYQALFGPNYNNDLAAFTSADVIALANNNHGEVLSFDGIKDAAGNVASNADVVIQDRMPAFMTKSYYDGSLVMEFNEAIMAPTDADSVTLRLENADASDFADIVLTELNRVTATVVNWELSSNGQTLTVHTTGMPPLTNGGASVRDLFNAGSYAETAYDSTSREHALLSYRDVRDTHAYVNTNGMLVNNSWNNWVADDVVEEDLQVLKFAPVDMIGAFDVSTNNTGFAVSAAGTEQTIIWTFTHPIATGGANDLFSAPNTPATLLDVEAWFEYNLGVTALVNPAATLDATGTIMTLTFDAPAGGVAFADVVSTVSPELFTSSLDVSETNVVNASANN